MNITTDITDIVLHHIHHIYMVLVQYMIPQVMEDMAMVDTIGMEVDMMVTAMDTIVITDMADIINIINIEDNTIYLFMDFTALDILAMSKNKILK